MGVVFLKCCLINEEFEVPFKRLKLKGLPPNYSQYEDKVTQSDLLADEVYIRGVADCLIGPVDTTLPIGVFQPDIVAGGLQSLPDVGAGVPDELHLVPV